MFFFLATLAFSMRVSPAHGPIFKRTRLHARAHTPSFRISEEKEKKIDFGPMPISQC